MLIKISAEFFGAGGIGRPILKFMLKMQWTKNVKATVEKNRLRDLL